MVQETLNGIFPGADTWTESPGFGSWYREEGRWAAVITRGNDTAGPRWEARVWLKDKGINEAGNGEMFTSVGCLRVNPYDEGSLAMAKGTADRMLTILSDRGLSDERQCVRAGLRGRVQADGDGRQRGWRTAIG